MAGILLNAWTGSYDKLGLLVSTATNTSRAAWRRYISGKTFPEWDSELRSESQSGPPPPPPKRTARLSTKIRTLLFLLVLSIILIGADMAAKNFEFHRLLSGIEKSESAMVDFLDEMDILLEQWDRRVAGESPTPREARTMFREYLTLARTTAETLGTHREEIDEVRWFLWHRDIGTTQNHYVDHIDAWIEDLRTTNMDSLGDESSEIHATWCNLVDPLRDAVPIVDVFELHDRVGKVIEEGGGSCAALQGLGQ